MNKIGFVVTWLLFVALVVPALAQQAVDRSTVEQQKIAWLIDSVATLHDASFIRNGKAYDAARAADHLRLKLRYAGERVKTAEQFIDCCATRSSMSGVNYSIRFADGRTVDAATFLRGKLATYPIKAGQSLFRKHPCPVADGGGHGRWRNGRSSLRSRAEIESCPAHVAVARTRESRPSEHRPILP